MKIKIQRVLLTIKETGKFMWLNEWSPISADILLGEEDMPQYLR